MASVGGPDWQGAKPSAAVMRAAAKLQQQVAGESAKISPERIERAAKSVAIGLHRHGAERTKVEGGKAPVSKEVAALRAAIAPSDPAVERLAKTVFGAAAAA